MRYSVTAGAALLCLIGSFSGPAYAQEPQAPKAFDYQSELHRLKTGDTSIDFTRLRLAFAKTKDFSPYSMDERELRGKAAKALNAKDFKGALELAEKILAINYLYPDAHMIAMIAESKLGHDERAAFHRKVLSGLFNSICEPDQGTTQSKPCKVIAVDEEYFVLQALGLQFKEQALITCAGNPCDRMTATDAESGKEVQMYFDVSIPFSRMGH
jgi:hypothetical protein